MMTEVIDDHIQSMTYYYPYILFDYECILSTPFAAADGDDGDGGGHDADVSKMNEIGIP